jgi:hypothetical protein
MWWVERRPKHAENGNKNCRICVVIHVAGSSLMCLSVRKLHKYVYISWAPNDMPGLPGADAFAVCYFPNVNANCGPQIICICYSAGGLLLVFTKSMR